MHHARHTHTCSVRHSRGAGWRVQIPGVLEGCHVLDPARVPRERHVRVAVAVAERGGVACVTIWASIGAGGCVRLFFFGRRCVPGCSCMTSRCMVCRYELVRNVAGDLVDSVKRVDTFVHPKDGRVSMSFRIKCVLRRPRNACVGCSDACWALATVVCARLRAATAPWTRRSRTRKWTSCRHALRRAARARYLVRGRGRACACMCAWTS